MLISPSFELPVSPVQTIFHPVLEKVGVKLILKRDDLIHPSISGNKWRKMKYNLVEAQQQGAKQLITFGGAYSNHIYATASAGKVFGFDTLGIIRGDELNPQSSPTLQYAAENGMQFRFVSRTAYRDKEEILEQLKQENVALEKAYYLPEGGSNHLALKGLAELSQEIYQQTQPDYIVSAVGKGGTIAGILASSNAPTHIIGIVALKGAKEGLFRDIQELLSEHPAIDFTRFTLLDAYHFGGYAKYNSTLLDFIKNFESYNPAVQLEQVYTGKMLYGIIDLAEKGYFKKGSEVVAVHTGGLQGRNNTL
ncbi:1-aminocyclopropane-1-carboxylate deaminase/D-cysteine desulfhydrase [Flectobacillus roseus]|uniref:Pyridoxal-phosphate dependent enzyme n=1 Tax=Flectobacillus roseus TaxID=502259 RepID=A0ABT6YFG5_9BACT|nr:pyridoxal-phosphate dependent enzyme [Flectobacillus roseus]MDI9862167.1 pyridoxal-phosphate dependent enzyme [Flectobacillus roseus]